MDTKKLQDRIDLRIDRPLKIEFSKFCKDKNIKLSQAGREALLIYIRFKIFSDKLLEGIQNPDLYEKFNIFYDAMPTSLKKAFNELMGSEEEKLIESTPPQLLKNLKVITITGQEKSLILKETKNK